MENANTEPDRSRTCCLSDIRSARRRQQAVETLTRAFCEVGGMERHLQRAVWRGPEYDPEYTRVAVADGRVVSAAAMTRRRLRFGPVTVQAVSVGPVGTHERFRKRGYAAAVMHDASRFLAQTDVVLAYLGGIAGFYHRFGYYPYRDSGSVRFPREAARKQGVRGRLRKMRRADIPAVAAIYDRATANRICAAARDRPVWDWLLKRAAATWMFQNPRVITDGNGRIRGHVSLAHGKYEIREMVIDHDEDSIRVALGALCREARRMETREISVPAPWNDPFTLFVRQNVGGSYSCSFHPNGDSLMKIVNLGTLLEVLLPLFRQRLSVADGSPAPTPFTLSSDQGEFAFVASADGGLKLAPAEAGMPVARIPQRWLTGLLTGYYNAAEVAACEGVDIPPEIMPMLNALFPRQWPFLWRADDF